MRICAKSSNFVVDFYNIVESRKTKDKRQFIMRKILLMVLLVCAGMVQAGEYAYLVFTNTEGTKTALSVTDLKMTVNGAQLDVINADGTVQFTLTELAAMQFSVDGENLPEGMENVLDADAPIDVYTILGIKVGHYNSLLEAAGVLGKGSYVISNGRISQTIVVR